VSGERAIVASVGEVVVALRRVAEDLPFVLLADALELAEDATAFAKVALHGTGQDEFWQVVEWFEKAIEGIGELQQLLTAIQRGVTTAANRLEGRGFSSSPVSPNQQTSPARVSALTKFGGATPEDLLAKLPQRTKTNLKTHGIWLDDQGQEHEPIVSGRDGLSRQAGDVLRRLGLGPPRGTLAVADHVEVKLAVYLRETGQRHVTLVINKDPCRTGEYSCDRLLSSILRPGQAVTVYWPNGVKTYQGGVVRS
jgi:hypothetical protein